MCYIWLTAAGRWLAWATGRALACSLFVALWPSLAAESSPPPIQPLESEYLVESWQTEQGLPDNYVNAIAQTPDGYLWIATFNGLARFNGVEFVVFDTANTPELPTSRITHLYCDRKGRLWIVSEYGDLSQWTQGRFRSFTEREGLPKPAGALVWEDHEGNIWTSSSYSATNCFQFVDGTFRPAGGTNTLYQRFGRAPDAQGYGWGIRDNFLFSTRPPQPFQAIIPGFKSPESWRLTAANDGGMWLIANRIQKFHQGRFEDFGPVPMPTDQFNGYLEDRGANLWVGTGIGELWRIGTNHLVRRFKLLNSTTLELGRSLFEDAEGNLWIGNGGDGLLRLKRRTLRTYDSRDGLASDVVRSLSQDTAGNIWLATVNRVDWFAENNPTRAEARGVSVKLPWDTFGARDGAIWIAGLGEGLLRIAGQKQTWVKEPGREIGAPELNVIFEDRRGDLHLGTPEGLFAVKDDSLVKSELPAGLPSMDVRSMTEDTTGRLYLGLNGQGLLRKNGPRWERFTTRDGLPDDHVWSLWADRNNAVWIGTHGRGLCRFKDGRFFNFINPPAGTELELPRIISCILEDDTAHLWFGSNQGIFRVDYQQLNEIADGHSRTADISHYDRADGMGSSQCTSDRQPTAWKAKDGKLWFATMKGATVVDPQILSFNPRPPPVAIEAVLIDDRKQPLAPSSTSENSQRPASPANVVKVPAGSYRLEFRYAGLSFRAPGRVRFQYRLEPFDQDWVNARNRRVAYYTKVPPGSYHFQVLAANDDNVWNNTGASIGVVIMPLVWQTNWFRAGAILLLVGLGIGLYELRVRGLTRRRAMQEGFSRSLIESQENERKRMAAELHDGLGQSLLVVKNYAALALKETKIPERTRGQLQEICDSASASIEEVRSIARALRPYQLDRFGLTKTLEDAAELVAQTGDLQIKTEIDNVDATFSAEGEISIYRIVQEWLNNVVKHARASTARLIVRKTGGIVRITLEDDGAGFDYDAVLKRSAAGLGLANLGERARLLGGTLKIETAPGKGTRLCVDIPCKI